jgi:hypothetical protein
MRSTIGRAVVYNYDFNRDVGIGVNEYAVKARTSQLHTIVHWHQYRNLRRYIVEPLVPMIG